ncbi:hypothetical protein GF324_10180 [bacterium]|nr:hypothetical protein [bacterium]
MIGTKDRTIDTQTYGRGLEGLRFGETTVGRIDGRAGRLWYRGYPLEQLCEQSNFEEVAYLVMHGELPNRAEWDAWDRELRAWRTPPRDALAVLQWLPTDAHPLMQYRTMLSVAACMMPDLENTRLDAQWQRPARILAWTAALAAAAIRHLKGQPPLPPKEHLGFAANFLWQALGREASEEECRAFEVSLIVQAEHGLHAAALGALLVISTGADLGGAVLAGMGALSGKLHGGANQDAFEMFHALSLGGPGRAQGFSEKADRVQNDGTAAGVESRNPTSGASRANQARQEGAPGLSEKVDTTAVLDHARAWTRRKLEEGFRFPGFGHRVYKTHDPRARALEPLAERMLRATGHGVLWEVYGAVKHEVEAKLGPRGIFANVDAVTGLVYHPLGLPTASFPIPFALAIQTGWMAHCLEYIPSGRMIEPGSVYLG